MESIALKLVCLACITGLQDPTLILNSEEGVSAKAVVATAFSLRTGTTDPLRAGDGKGPDANPIVGLPSEHEGFALQTARISVTGKLNKHVAGYLHIAGGTTGGMALEGYVDASPFKGFTVRAGRWLQQLSPLIGRRVEQRFFVETTMAAETFLGGELVENGLQLRYEGPIKSFPFAISLAAVNGDNPISFNAKGIQGDDPENPTIDPDGIGGDILKRMLYVARLSTNPGALFNQQLTVGGFVALGKNYTGPGEGHGNDTNLFGFDIGTHQSIGAIDLTAQVEVTLRNFATAGDGASPESGALNAMDATAVELVVGYKAWELGLRADILALLTAEPPIDFGTDKKWRMSVAGTYRLAPSTFFRAQYNTRNDTIDAITAHEVMLQAVASY